MASVGSTSDYIEDGKDLSRGRTRRVAIRVQREVKAATPFSNC